MQNCQPKYKESKPGKQTKSLSQPSTSQSMLQIMGKKSEMPYASNSTPEKQRLSKFDCKANVQSSDSCEEELPIERGDPSGADEEEQARPGGSDVFRGYESTKKTQRKKGKKRQKYCQGSKSGTHTNVQ